MPPDISRVDACIASAKFLWRLNALSPLLATQNDFVRSTFAGRIDDRRLRRNGPTFDIDDFSFYGLEHADHDDANDSGSRTDAESDSYAEPNTNTGSDPESHTHADANTDAYTGTYAYTFRNP